MLCLGLAALAGCRDRAPAPDAGDRPPQRDAGPAAADTDGDGVCDDTELSRGTDPMLADTDGDGLTDRVEIDLGFVATRTDSPNRSILVALSERPGALAEVSVVHTVRGEGQSYKGAFYPLPVVDAAGLDAGEFYAGSIAFGAIPPDNVFEIRPEEERITGVVGRTRLVYQVRFESLLDEPRSCTRAYPWRYVIKRDDGALVLSRRYILVVGPQSPDAAWCAPVGPCI